ncbi:MAG: hypothetical protein V3R96_04830, partial [Dehalococcoidales bacterium]
MPKGLDNNQQAKFLQIIADPLNEEQLLSDLFQFLSSQFRGMYFSLWLHDISKHKEYALLVGEYGYETRGVIHDFQRVPIGTGVVGRTLESGGHIWRWSNRRLPTATGKLISPMSGRDR